MTSENNFSKEKLLDHVTEIGRHALQAAYEVHQNLGVLGLETVRRNEHGETALKIDIEAEEAVIRILAKNKLSIILESEEHGLVRLGENPQLFGTLDGLDGTAAYRKERGVGRYGTMLSIYNSTNPKYADYIFGGIMEHSSHRLYFASKGKGCWKVENRFSPQVLKCSIVDRLDSKTCRLHADIPFDSIFGGNMMEKMVSKLQNFPITVLKSSAINYADLIDGKVEAVIEGTRKGNLEIAVAYSLVTEAGGVMVDIKGESLGSKFYLNYAQKEHLPVISVCNTTVAKELISLLNQK